MNRTRMKAIILAMAMLAISGCATQTFVINYGDRSGYARSSQETHSFLIGGIGQEQIFNAEHTCGEDMELAKVSASLTFTDIVASIITFGIYTPRHAEVFCREISGRS